ncbi:ADAMTS-like protein 5 isoform X3 [Fukomys damarensis]|uniref:ADAMTS-like protein 5 isoform X3 n=1 Tax=Fukomys damarensis TaxID=885580 RepID=UPI00053F7BA3|nr:ADAMTS-like protein 5 isoform X3 [Fukomys damarensis]
MGFSPCPADTSCVGLLCSPRPRPLQNLLLLWTLLSCGLGVPAQGLGEWTPWGSWTRCSSSCGRGVSVRSRRCIRTAHQGLCLSETFSVPSTMAALSWAPRKPTNGYPSMGAGLELLVILLPQPPKCWDLQACSTTPGLHWTLFLGLCRAQGPEPTPNQCDLNCLAEGQTFYHSFGRVLDGTPCSPGAQGLCVAGRCLNAGCDGVLGSGALEDRCGRCGGANDSCLFVQRVFRDAGAFAGYWNVTLIPVGARHIRVVQRSRNYLALMGGNGRYVLNGNWAVSPPGTYDAAGTRVVYTRAAGPEETLHAAGPTSQDLLLQAQAQVQGWAQRQPQPREVEPQPPQLLERPVAHAPTRTPDPCPPCPDTRGRAHRLLHYCGSDFVFQARVLGSHRQAQETRYEVRILLIYKNRSPLRTREYVWAPGPCPCPPLAPHREYLLAIRRLVSPDGTQDRLLLPHAGYARPWSPAEDSRARLAARRCPG